MYLALGGALVVLLVCIYAWQNGIMMRTDL
jgi:hypothetical protein